MDDISIKALIIGVSIFVTMLITTVVLFEFQQISNIYKGVAETDITFESRLDELNKYDDSNNEFYGLDVLNTVEKYRHEDTINVCLGEETWGLCKDVITDADVAFDSKYTSKLEKTNKGYSIIFEVN